VARPAGPTTRIASIDSFDGELDEAFPPMSVAVRLADELDVSRGDMIASPGAPPHVSRELEADVCWMAETPLRAGARYAIKHTTRSVRAIVEDIRHRIDVHSLEPRNGGTVELALNDIGRVRLRTSAPLVFDSYARNRETGSFILIDEATNDTVGAAMIVDSSS
jgi:sulfate adenylyltransferase subunit 1 (EFTu-like GTPase family)